MADINTVLRRVKVEAPNTRNQQQVLAYVPLANGDTPGIVKPDGKQFYVDADGTLHVNAEYVRRINDISFKYDPDGNTVVTVIFNDETTDEFLVKKGDTGLPYIISTSLIGMNASETTEHNFKRPALSRTPVIGDIIFSRFYNDADDYQYIGLFLVNNTSYGADGVLLANTTLVSRSRITGPKGDKGDPGADGVGITSISKVVASTEGNVYRITLSNGSSYEFVAPFGPQGIQGPKGEKGDKGDKFSIDKVYSSVDEMNSGFSTDSVPQGGFVLIDTGNVEDPDNAKLYVKGELSYRYVTDLSGSQGIQGPKGDPGSTVQVMLSMDGAIESKRVIFTVADAGSFLEYRQNLQEFIVSMHLPVVGALDESLEVAITFGDTTYYLYTLSESQSVHLTIGDLMSVSSYNETSGYYFNTRMVFLSNSEFVGFALVPPSVTAKQLSKILSNSNEIECTVNGTKVKFTLSEQVKTELSKTLRVPDSSPTVTEIVAIGTDGTQTSVKLGTGVKLQGDTIVVDKDNIGAILYEKAQTLSNDQKAQARSNIGAGSSSFSGSYMDLGNLPTVDTTNETSLITNKSEQIKTLNLHKVSKTGKLSDLIDDETHRTVTDEDKIAWREVSNKMNSDNGTGTGTTTLEYIVAQGIKLLNMLATSKETYVVVTDSNGNMKKRAMADLLSDIGGVTQAQVNTTVSSAVGNINTLLTNLDTGTGVS